jgi:uncharacterized membrane protein (DUF106 family)
MIGILNNVFTTLFSPIISLPFSLSMFIIASMLSLINALLYRFLIDHEVMKENKKRIQELQEKAKKVQKEDPKKAEEIFKEMFELMHKQMHMNMKPMLISLIFILLFLPWISSISLQTIPLSDGEGEFLLKVFVSQPREIAVKVENDKVFFDINKDGAWDISGKEGDVVNIAGPWRINKITDESINIGAIVRTPFSLPFFSYGFGWLMWYIVCSTLMLYIFRRLMGINY